jgi:hypothetical protein
LHDNPASFRCFRGIAFHFSGGLESNFTVKNGTGRACLENFVRLFIPGVHRGMKKFLPTARTGRQLPKP